MKNRIYFFTGTGNSLKVAEDITKVLPDLDNTLPFYEFLTAFSRIGWCIKREKTNEHFYFEFNNQIDGIIEKYLTLR